MADTPIAVAAGTLSITGVAPAALTGRDTVSAVTLPMMSLFSAIDQGLTLPSLTLDATVLNGAVINDVENPLVLPLFEASATVYVGRVLTAEVTLPMMQLEASSGASVTATIPLCELSSTIIVGGVVTSDITMPAIAAEITVQHKQSSVDITMPMVQVSSNVLQGGLLDITLALPFITDVISVLGGQVGTVSASLPMMELEASLYGEVSATAELTLPREVVAAEMYGVYAETYRTLAVNVETEAISTYVGYGYNSFAKIGDSYFAASSTGIYELVGDTDTTAEIEAAIVLKNDNFGDSRMSRIVAVYLSADVSDDMRIGITTNGNVYVYEVPANGERGLVSRRIDTVRGEKAVYWQTTLQNVGGADFSISAVEPLVKKMGRRI